MGLTSMSHTLTDSIESILDDETKCWHPYLCALERKCGVSKVHFFLIICFLLVLYLMLGVRAALLCNLVGFLVPARKTLRVLLCPNFEENAKWLTYWLIYAAVSLLDHFADWIIEAVCPLYWPIKCVFLLWCMSDLANNGSCLIYTCFLRPLSLLDCYCIQRFAVNDQKSFSSDHSDDLCSSDHSKSC